jgi:5-methylthioribose kinase
VQRHLTDENLPDYLRERGLLGAAAAARVEPAGDGNINWVRRVRPAGGGQSFVVKQARSSLERFPEYEAPTERLVFEARYYETVRPFDATGVCPRVLAFDEGERVLVLEDLGDAERLDRALGRGAARSDPATVLDAAAAVAGFLGAVHAGTREAASALAPRFANDGMQRLHGDHIFALPLRPNEFPLPPALRARAATLWQDAALVALADAAYARYLEPRGALVHADAQAGNIILCRGGPKLLDAEICHVGDPAFDLGSLLAHLSFDALASGRAADARPLVAAAWTAYRAAEGGTVRFEDAARYAGLECLRRTIGAARVAAVAEPTAGLAVLDAALRWIRTPAGDPKDLLLGA